MFRSKILSICINFAGDHDQSYSQILIGLSNPQYKFSSSFQEEGKYSVKIRTNDEEISFITTKKPNQIRDQINKEIKELLNSNENFREYII